MTDFDFRVCLRAFQCVDHSFAWFLPPYSFQSFVNPALSPTSSFIHPLSRMFDFEELDNAARIDSFELGASLGASDDSKCCNMAQSIGVPAADEAAVQQASNKLLQEER